MKSKEFERSNIPLAVIGLSHKTADLQIREKATFTDRQQQQIVQELIKRFKTRGLIILSTCNRIEIYFCGRKAIKYISDICCFLDQIKHLHIYCNQNLTYRYTGRKTIHHFFRVIASLDSQLIGEPQITGQVKAAYEKSHQNDQTDILLNKMYHLGMQVEKQVRRTTYLADGAVSVGFAGVELARKIFGDLHNSTVLLIGAGDTAELAALHFANRGVQKILVVNRTHRHAVTLAHKFGGEPLRMSRLDDALYQSDVVISATSSDRPLITHAILEDVARKREYKPIFLIDLAIPRDIDPKATEIDGIFLYNLDSLQHIVNQNIRKRHKEIPKAEKIVEDHVKEFIKWYNTLPVVKTITKLSHYLEDIRAREFERLKNRFPEESLNEVEYLSKSLMKKFLHHHIMTLRKNNENPQRQKEHIDLVGEIYKLNDSGSSDE